MNNFEIRREGEVESGGEEVFSKAVRAGKRTYFFDVKATRNGDYYLTITESRKKMGEDGNFFFDKHKIYLYKEDFAKFGEGFEVAAAFIKDNRPEFFESLGTDTILSSIEVEFDKL